MPGPSSAPRSVAPSVSKRRFTLAQANKTLPLVRRVVGDIVKTHDLALSLQAEAERAGNNGHTTAPLQAKLDAAMDHLQDYVAELAEIGCELKDYKTGLIDFTGSHRGRDVCLCWRLGEDRIAFWHEVNAGAAGRKSVSSLDPKD